MNTTPVRYEPHEKPPHPLAAGLGAQVVVLMVTGVMVTPLVVSRAAGLDASSTGWLVFAALLAAGLSTWLQTLRMGVLGSGYVLFVGSNVAFVGVATSAIEGGGLPLMATLVAVSALSCFVFTGRMGAMRRVLTPAVGGMVLMLMSLSVAPVVWKLLKKVPPQFADSGAPGLLALCTLVPIVLISLFGGNLLRLWAPLVGVAVGSTVAWQLGMIDPAPVLAAPWVGLPQAGWPGLDLSFGTAFWALLPAFVLISLVGCIETYADGIAVQRSSHRESKPIDFRSVQGAINADGIGSAIAGVLGTVPNTVYSMSVGIVDLTRVAALRVAYWGGLFLILLAFSPKISALIGAMPSPVAAAYILMILVLLFGHGLRMVTEEPLGFEAGIAVCLGFWLGVGFQGGFLYNERFPDWAQLFLSNGTTSGGIVAIVIMALLSLRHRARDRISVPLAPEALGPLREVVQRFCKRLGWDSVAENRVMLAAEEALLFLLENRSRGGATAPSQLQVRLREAEGQAEIEYVSAPADSNIEGALASLPDEKDSIDIESELSLRLLRGMTRELRHMQYHGVDYLMIRLDSASR
ncbi:MAG: hypothetical protein FGM40_08455 [Rhodocyclaceae bacterium]|nr:hypothetical protein [Rhodocyclaceae bacterium]